MKIGLLQRGIHGVLRGLDARVECVQSFMRRVGAAAGIERLRQEVLELMHLGDELVAAGGRDGEFDPRLYQPLENRGRRAACGPGEYELRVCRPDALDLSCDADIAEIEVLAIDDAHAAIARYRQRRIDAAIGVLAGRIAAGDGCYPRQPFQLEITNRRDLCVPGGGIRREGEAARRRMIAGREAVEHGSVAQQRHHRAAHRDEARPHDHRGMRRHDLVEELHGDLRARLVVVEDEPHALAADAAMLVGILGLELEHLLLSAGEEGAVAGQRQNRVDGVFLGPRAARHHQHHQRCRRAPRPAVAHHGNPPSFRSLVHRPIWRSEHAPGLRIGQWRSAAACVFEGARKLL